MLLYCSTQSIQAASFDCAKAGTKVEHIICDNPDISKLDDEMDAAFKAVLLEKIQANSVKQLQKKWIRKRNQCTDSACVKAEYISQIRDLNIEIELKKPVDVCSVVAHFASSNRLGELVKNKASNIHISQIGKDVDLSFSWEGTGHYPVAHAVETGTKVQVYEIPIPPPESNMYGTGEYLGLINFRGDNYIIHYIDFMHPVSTISLSDGSICEFTTSTTEILDPNSATPDLCNKIQQGDKSLLSMPFDNSDQLTEEETSKKMDPIRDSILGTQFMDFANNGNPANITKLVYLLPGGTGCQLHDFQQINTAKTAFEDGPGAELLEELQSSYKFRATPCDSAPEFLQYNGRIYYEMKPRKWPPESADDEYHFVNTVINGKVHNVCNFYFETQVKPTARYKN